MRDRFISRRFIKGDEKRSANATLAGSKFLVQLQSFAMWIRNGWVVGWIILLLHGRSAQCSTAVDKQLYRGIIAPDDASMKTIQRSFRSKLNQYKTKFRQEEGWRVLSRSRDRASEVAMLRCKGDPTCPYIRMKVTLPASASSLLRFTSLGNWNTFMRLINPFFNDVKTVRQTGQTMVAYQRTKRILTFARRDFGLVSVVDDLPRRQMDGVYVSAVLSLRSARLLPRQAGYTRAFQDLVCFFRPLANDRTELTIILRTDLNDSTNSNGTNGRMPMGLVMKTFGTFGCQALDGLERVVRQETIRASFGATSVDDNRKEVSPN